MFSHTGNEIQQLSERLGKKPDKVITNLDPQDPKINKKLLKSNNMYYTQKKPNSSDYNRLFTRGDFVTLHGWMRIVPSSVCKDVEIYNLHPGLITKYPELKGADPQQRVLDTNKTYKHVGCVIHRVTKELDGGEVIMERATNNHYAGVDQLTDVLHNMAGDMWYEFLSYRLKGELNVSFK